MPSLLLVDDDRDQLEIRCLLLERSGHQVRTASSAAEAIRVYEQTQPGQVVMDLSLPRREDGLTLIRELRARSKSVRILVLSGRADTLAQLPEGQLINRFLRKPVRSQHLLEAIEDIA